MTYAVHDDAGPIDGLSSPHNARLLVRLGVALACATALLQTLLHVGNARLLDHRIALFEIEEGGVATWAATSATFAAGALALLIGVVDHAERWRSATVALGFAFLSFDDAVVIHERLAFRATDALDVSVTYAQVIWPSVYLPVLVALAVLLVGLSRPARDALRVVVFGLVLLVAAVCLEVSGVRVDRPILESSVIVLEEAVEVAGWILVATGLAVRLITAPSSAAPHEPGRRPSRG